MESMRVLSTHEEVISALRSATGGNSHVFKAFYNSRLNAVVTDPVLMQIPIDDHMVHRSHSLFDALVVHKGRGYLLREHLERVRHCAVKAKIELPMPVDVIGNVLKQVAVCSGLTSCKVRYWVSTGPGNMAIWPEANMSVLYALAVDGPDPIETMLQDHGQSEVTITVPVKAHIFDTVKTTNYILDAMTVLQAASEGGHHGIIADTDGYIPQTSMGHICFLLPGKRLVTPPFDPLSNKSLISRVLAYAQEMTVTGEVTQIETRKVTVSEGKTATEVVEVLGDSLIPVIAWDGSPVGSGSPGPLWLSLRTRLIAEIQGSDPLYTSPLPLLA